jgi:hypothetical protein
MTPHEQEQLERLLDEHASLSHALQSGVRWEHERGSDDGSPKHLRTGVNIALRDHSSLVNLLVKKGVITDLEYAHEIVSGMREEVEAYEKRISEATGKEIHLL